MRDVHGHGGQLHAYCMCACVMCMGVREHMHVHRMCIAAERMSRESMSERASERMCLREYVYEDMSVRGCQAY